MSLMAISLISSSVIMTICIAIVAKSFFKVKEQDAKEYEFLEIMKEEHPEEYKEFLEESGLDKEDFERNDNPNNFWFGYIMGNTFNDLFK